MKKIKVKAVRVITVRGEDPNDVSPEACRKTTMSPGSVFELPEGDEKSGATKVIRSGAAEETTQRLSTPQELEDLRVDHEKHLKRLNEARLKQIASENNG